VRADRLRRGVGLLVLLVAAVLVPIPLAAQGLGDTAARERQKREEKKSPAPAKVYTNQDLPGASKGEGASDAPTSPGAGAGPDGKGSAAKAGSPGGPAEPLDKERSERKLLEAEWRVKFANAREELAKAEADSWREVVRTEFYQGVPVQMKIKEQVETEELKRARQALADLEEEFRRSGLPPGWARER